MGLRERDQVKCQYEKGSIAVLNGVGEKSLTWKVLLEERLEREKGVSHVKSWWGGIPGREASGKRLIQVRSR